MVLSTLSTLLNLDLTPGAALLPDMEETIKSCTDQGKLVVVLVDARWW